MAFGRPRAHREGMFAVLAAGLVGYALGGWLGVAVGACSATAVTVLLEPLTPPGDRETAHERRMRRSRRYRARYESLEDAWRHPYQPRRKAWKPAGRPAQATPTVEAPAPVEAVVNVEAPEPAPVLPAPTSARKRPSRASTAPRATKPTKPAKKREVSAQPRSTGRTRKAAPSPRPTSGRSTGD
jgi:xanthine/CO dehydrogenase XdhC/CoxF family maturation factor